MGHYDDFYDYEREQDRLRRIESLEEQLKDFNEFRIYKHDRVRKWHFHGKVEELYNRIITEIKAELYSLKN